MAVSYTDCLVNRRYGFCACLKPAYTDLAQLDAVFSRVPVAARTISTVTLHRVEIGESEFKEVDCVLVLETVPTTRMDGQDKPSGRMYTWEHVNDDPTTLS